MKVLLVKPHIPAIAKGSSPALSLGYLASNILQDNHKVQILDLSLYYRSESVRDVLVEKIKDFNPDMVGITSNTRERRYAFECAKWIKSVGDITVVMGGCHVTCRPEETLERVKEIDIVVRGEGEITFRELCNKGLKNLDQLESVNGIGFRNSDGSIHLTPHRDYNNNLDEFSFPAFDLMEMDKYNITFNIPGEKKKFTHIITSRGCPFHCAFCSAAIFSGSRVRYRSPENVLDEVEYLLSTYRDLDGIMFLDDFFLANKKRVLRVCELIKERGLKFEWYAWSRVDAIDPKILPILKEAGCTYISMGVESGSDHVLSLMSKSASSKRAVKAIKDLRKFGIHPRTSIIFNYPGERYRDIFYTYLFFLKAKLKPHEFTTAFSPILYPDTALTSSIEKINYLPNNFNWVDEFSGLDYDTPCYVPNDIFIRRILHKFFRTFYNVLKNIV